MNGGRYIPAARIIPVAVLFSNVPACCIGKQLWAHQCTSITMNSSAGSNRHGQFYFLPGIIQFQKATHRLDVRSNASLKEIRRMTAQILNSSATMAPSSRGVVGSTYLYRWVLMNISIQLPAYRFPAFAFLFTVAQLRQALPIDTSDYGTAKSA